MKLSLSTHTRLSAGRRSSQGKERKKCSQAIENYELRTSYDFEVLLILRHALFVTMFFFAAHASDDHMTEKTTEGPLLEIESAVCFHDHNHCFLKC